MISISVTPAVFYSGCLARPVCAVDFVQHFLEAVERPVEIVARDDQGRSEADDRTMGVLREHALCGQSLADFARARDSRIDLGARPQPAPAHFSQRRTFRGS